MERIDIFSIKAFWGNLSFDYVCSPAVGYSGGILCVWDLSLVVKDNSTISDSFVAIKGTWIPSSTKLLIISVYAPQELTEKRILWDYLRHMIDTWDGECILLGYFNEVRSIHERYGTVFNSLGSNSFNNFITMAGLFDLPLEGYSYTWSHKSVSKMSKLDRFLISEGLLTLFPSLSALCLDRHLSDHRHILMGRSNEDLVSERSNLLKELHDLNSNASLDMIQKAKILFANLNSPRLIIDFQFLNTLSLEQLSDIERDVTYDEIKNAVWDCGTNKSPGPDGFTFEFFRRYWKTIDDDVVAAVLQFFSSGSVYKIIAKILANRLSLVISSLISDVQSAFVSNGQILDGPFILNELLSWCKHKKSKAMIFKVDFEKAFDSVRWDYLDDVLNKFGFRVKWRGWIQGCLNSAMGSILVNGSLTSEFKFFKGLKQGDPLSPFLYILIMESLHLSFKNVVNVGLYKGIPIDDSLILSHLFYADDVLMGIGIPREDVLSAAESIGCSIFSTPFNFLGVEVGDIMSRRSSWEETIDRKLSLIGWKNILASMKNRGLGVSSFFALNRALLFKWIWLFISHDSSLWARFIKAIYGTKDALDISIRLPARCSPWLNILREFRRLSQKGTNLFSFVKKSRLELEEHVTIASKLRDMSLMPSFRRAPRGGIEEDQFRLLRAKVAHILLPRINDRWVLNLESSGEFSMKSARSFIDDSLLPKADAPTRWVKVVPIKINILRLLRQVADKVKSFFERC
ncbi:RNA-directed DNA polymerase, eukaryota [Tanacetum coccineum]